jgi:hypothetical protein
MVLAVCGDQIVGTALAMLLSDSCYAVRFVTASSLNEPGSLAGGKLLLFIPTLGSNAVRRESLAVLSASAVVAADVPILRLVSPPEVTQDSRVGSQCTVPWPCSIEELKRRIEHILLANPAAHRTVRDSGLRPDTREGSR